MSWWPTCRVDRAEALVRLLDRLSDDAPIVIVLEDLHWADPDTVAVLDDVTDNLGGAASHAS
jgi:predicted ATPase